MKGGLHAAVERQIHRDGAKAASVMPSTKELKAAVEPSPVPRREKINVPNGAARVPLPQPEKVKEVNDSDDIPW